MSVEIENNFQQKFMLQAFAEGTQLKTAEDIAKWKSAWLKALEQWHSPYKVILDCSHLDYIAPNLENEIKLLFKFFEGFFMRSVAGFSDKERQDLNIFPFEMQKSEEDALKQLNIRQRKKISKGSADFRSTIFLENHFQQQCVELSFTEAVKIDSAEKLAVLRDKLSNNLMQWHSPWNLIVDCSHFEFDMSLAEPFERDLKFFQGFFLKQVIGYTPFSKESVYPFKVYRSRHKAAALLESTGVVAGNTANCSSRK